MSEQTFHAEHKVTGGKLVVADIVTDGRAITGAKISGDFFLEPEEAFFEIAPALVGAGVNAPAAELIERLDSALAPFGDTLQMHGFATSDIATVVRRAVARATEFSDFEWSVIHGDVLPTAVNVALDEVLLKEVDSGRRGPTLRVWEWEDRAAVIGSFQSYANEIRPEGVQEHGIDVVRRISGGGAMFMEGGNCITYSLYFPESLIAGLDYADSYAYLDRWVIAALAEHGVNAWYVPINDITSSDGKIGGAAQRRLTSGTVLHHVTMSYDIDADKMVEVLRIGEAKLSDKGVRSAKKRVDPLRRQTGASRQDIIASMIGMFSQRFGASDDAVTAEEMSRAEQLVASKFGTAEWTHRVP